MTKQLPEKFSDTIDLALDDLEKIEQDERYKVDMGVWHTGHPDGKCHVCLGGAVMAQTLQILTDECVIPEELGKGVANKINALDAVRRAHSWHCYRDALSEFHGKALYEPFPPPSFSKHVPDYSLDPEGFKQTLREVAQQYREIGE